MSTSNNKNLFLTDDQLERLIQGEHVYYFFNDESGCSDNDIDSDHESVDSQDTNSIIKTTDSDNSNSNITSNGDVYLGKFYGFHFCVIYLIVHFVEGKDIITK